MKSKYLLLRFSGRSLLGLLVTATSPVAVLDVVLLSSRWLPLAEINAISLSVSLELDACSVTNKEAFAKFVAECVKNRTTPRPTTTTTRSGDALVQSIFWISFSGVCFVSARNKIKTLLLLRPIRHSNGFLGLFRAWMRLRWPTRTVLLRKLCFKH